MGLGIGRSCLAGAITFDGEVGERTLIGQSDLGCLRVRTDRFDCKCCVTFTKHNVFADGNLPTSCHNTLLPIFTAILSGGNRCRYSGRTFHLSSVRINILEPHESCSHC